MLFNSCNFFLCFKTTTEQGCWRCRIDCETLCFALRIGNMQCIKKKGSSATMCFRFSYNYLSQEDSLWTLNQKTSRLYFVDIKNICMCGVWLLNFQMWNRNLPKHKPMLFPKESCLVFSLIYLLHIFIQFSKRKKAIHHLLRIAYISRVQYTDSMISGALE